jgi:hypothetical protein
MLLPAAQPATLIENLQTLVARASDTDADTRKRLERSVRLGSRLARLKIVKAAANSDFSRDPDRDRKMIEYHNLGFNTVVINDVLVPPSMTATGWWGFMSEDQIREAVRFARENGKSILLHVHAPALDHMPDMTPELLAGRIALWSKYDEGDILGVYLLGDDNFLTGVRVPVATQIAWREAIRGVTTSIPVLGLIGEHAAVASPEEREALFSPAAFDHLLVLTYPYDLGYVLGADLDATDPDARDLLDLYLSNYFHILDQMYFSKLFKGQVVLPVGQAFKYPASPAQKQVSGEIIYDIIMVSNRELLRLRGREDSIPVLLFHWSVEGGVPAGIGDSEDPSWSLYIRTVSHQAAMDAKALGLPLLTLARKVLGYR